MKQTINQADEFVLLAAREKLLAFALIFYPEYCITESHKIIADKLSKVEAHEISRLMLSTPPQVGKTTLAVILFAVWYLGKNLDKTCIFASYSATRANDVAKEVHNIMCSDTYKLIFPDAEVAKRDSSSNFRIGKHGKFVAVGMGAGGTGYPGHIIILDDIIKNLQEAMSPSISKTAENWYDSVIKTRLHPDSVMIAIGTRWTSSDIYSYIENSKSFKWDVVNIPALNDDNVSNYLPHRQTDWWEAIKADTSAMTFSAMYMGRPVPTSGGMINISDFQIYDRVDLPEADYYLIAVDSAYKEKELNDPSVFIAAQVTGANVYILNVFKKRMLYPELKKNLIIHANKQPDADLLIESAASGLALIPDLKGLIKNNIIAMSTKGQSKQIRCNNVLGTIEAGNVHLPENAAWLDDFLYEISQFPYFKHDDQVDALVHLLTYIRDRKRKNMSLGNIVFPSFSKSSYRNI